MKILLFLIDSFSTDIFRGNPAGVCILQKDQELNDSVKQDIAMELNQAETAFVQLGDPASIPLQWFTPTVEVDLCGHATLASAHVLFHELQETADVSISSQNPPSISFSTKSGMLSVEKQADQLAMYFPSRRPDAYNGNEQETQRVMDYLGITDMVSIQSVPETDARFYVVELANRATLSALTPNFSLADELENKGNVIVTTASTDQDLDFYSRVFAPGLGIPEDPVTGAAHCSLAPYWSAKLQKPHLRAYQDSKRGGYLELFFNYEQKSETKVTIKGYAKTVMRGELSL